MPILIVWEVEWSAAMQSPVRLPDAALLVLLVLATASVLVCAADPPQDQRQEQVLAIAEIARFGGDVKIDDQAPENPVVEVTLVGEQISDIELAHLEPSLRCLPHLRKVTLTSPHVTDAGLAYLRAVYCFTMPSVANSC